MPVLVHPISNPSRSCSPGSPHWIACRFRLRGECHALMGENGAGKSTLGKILAGIYRPDDGRASLSMARMYTASNSPAAALKAGVGMVHQELAFCPDLSVAENLMHGPVSAPVRVDARSPGDVRRARSLLGKIGVVLDVTQPMRGPFDGAGTTRADRVGGRHGARVSWCSTSRQARFPSRRLSNCSSSSRTQSARRDDDLRVAPHARGLSSVRSDQRAARREIRRHGRSSRCHAGSHRADDDRPDRSRVISRSTWGQGRRQSLLDVKGLSSPGKFKDVSFQIKAGEIVGFAGLVGAGRSEIAQGDLRARQECRGARRRSTARR